MKKSFLNTYTIWMFVLLMCAMAIVLIIGPLMNLYFQIPFPMVEINDTAFMVYGYQIPPEKQWGYAFGSAVLLMLPTRIAHFAFLKVQTVLQRTSITNS
jgi:hypothetical protein